MAMWNDYEKIARRLDRIAKAFERIANALETANIIEADRKTEPSGYKMKPFEQTEPQRNVAEDIVESFGFKAESYRQAKAKTEPQTEKPKIRKRIDKPFRAVWLDDDHNEIGTPQTERSE